MTCHQYCGWEHVLSQTPRRSSLVPVQSPSTRVEWQRRRGWRGLCKHLYPNWWSFMTALFVKLNTEKLHYTLLVTFLGALNIMTYHSVASRYSGGGNISSCSLLQSSIWQGCEKHVEVNQRTWSWFNWTWRHRVMVPSQNFSAIWLWRNEALLQGFCYNVSQVRKWQH